VLKAGDIVLAHIQYMDTFETKLRPALILFEEYDNFVVAGVTSNTSMDGIPLTRKDGAIKESVIKLNYIFTISKMMILKPLFSLAMEKKKMVYEELVKRVHHLRG